MRDREELDVDVELETDPDEIIEDITGEEISGAIKRMKRGEATADDELPVEVSNEAGEGQRSSR